MPSKTVLVTAIPLRTKKSIKMSERLVKAMPEIAPVRKLETFALLCWSILKVIKDKKVMIGSTAT